MSYHIVWPHFPLLLTKLTQYGTFLIYTTGAFCGQISTTWLNLQEQFALEICKTFLGYIIIIITKKKQIRKSNGWINLPTILWDFSGLHYWCFLWLDIYHLVKFARTICTGDLKTFLGYIIIITKKQMYVNQMVGQIWYNISSARQHQKHLKATHITQNCLNAGASS